MNFSELFLTDSISFKFNLFATYHIVTIWNSSICNSHTYSFAWCWLYCLVFQVRRGRGWGCLVTAAEKDDDTHPTTTSHGSDGSNPARGFPPLTSYNRLQPPNNYYISETHALARLQRRGRLADRGRPFATRPLSLLPIFLQPLPIT